MNIVKIDFPFNQGKYGNLRLSLSSGLLFIRSEVWWKLGWPFIDPKLGDSSLLDQIFI